jgi:hypothetical protein
MRVGNAAHATLRGHARDDGSVPAGAAIPRCPAATATRALAAVQAIAAALVATPLHAQLAQPTPWPRNVEERAVLATPDAAPASPGVEVLTIDTRPTGVDLGLHRHAEQAEARAVAPTRVPMETGGFAATTAVAAPAAADAGAASPVATSSAASPAAATARASPAAATAAATPVPEAGSQDAPGTADALDAPLSAASMNLDAVTAAAAAEVSRNRNGTMVEGRIVAPR